jgi:hypothetical protein
MVGISRFNAQQYGCTNSMRTACLLSNGSCCSVRSQNNERNCQIRSDVRIWCVMSETTPSCCVDHMCRSVEHTTPLAPLRVPCGEAIGLQHTLADSHLGIAEIISAESRRSAADLFNGSQSDVNCRETLWQHNSRERYGAFGSFSLSTFEAPFAAKLCALTSDASSSSASGVLAASS